jgi:hypothetical protein
LQNKYIFLHNTNFCKELHRFSGAAAVESGEAAGKAWPPHADAAVSTRNLRSPDRRTSSAAAVLKSASPFALIPATGMDQCEKKAPGFHAGGCVLLK